MKREDGEKLAKVGELAFCCSGATCWVTGGSTGSCLGAAFSPCLVPVSLHLCSFFKLPLPFLASQSDPEALKNEHSFTCHPSCSFPPPAVLYPSPPELSPAAGAVPAVPAGS